VPFLERLDLVCTCRVRPQILAEDAWGPGHAEARECRLASHLTVDAGEAVPIAFDDGPSETDTDGRVFTTTRSSSARETTRSSGVPAGREYAERNIMMSRVVDRNAPEPASTGMSHDFCGVRDASCPGVKRSRRAAVREIRVSFMSNERGAHTQGRLKRRPRSVRLPGPEFVA
jgi:hypothetical protein